MKKLLFLMLLCITLFTSCSKERKETINQARIFSYIMCESSSMYKTKTVETNDVLDIINSTLPDKINITLTSQTSSKTFRGTTNESIILPSDAYRVTGHFSGEALSSCLQGSTGYVTDAPYIEIDNFVNVNDNDVAYTIQGVYKSFAIVFDTEEVDKVYVTNKSGNKEELQLITVGTIKLAFIQGDYSKNYLTLQLTPKNKEYNDVTYTLANVKGTNLTFVENGKFYIFHPKINEQNLKVVSISLPTFTRIDIEPN